MNCRRRPLCTVVLSLNTIVWKIYQKAEDFRPISTLTRHVAMFSSMFSPLITIFHHSLLVVLSAIDDLALAAEVKAEWIFPPFKRVFDKFDEIMIFIDTFPEKLDVIASKFPAFIHRTPILEGALLHAVYWLNFLTCVLTRYGAGSAKEKDITVDSVCCGNEDEKRALEDLNVVGERSGGDDWEGMPCLGGSSESVLVQDGDEKCFDGEGVLGGGGEGRFGVGVEEGKDILMGGEAVKRSEDLGEMEIVGVRRGKPDLKIKESSDPILALFESAWLASPRG